MAQAKRQRSVTPACRAAHQRARRWPRRILLGALAAALLLAPLATSAEDAAESGAPSATVGIAADPPDTRLTQDLTSVLAHDGIRILPVIGRGPLQNADDLLHLKGIDFAILPADLFGYLRREQLLPEAPQRIRLVLKLYDEQFHLLARNDVPDITALEGKQVAFGLPGSGDAVTATMIFDALGVHPQPVFVDERRALSMLQSGALAAVALVAAEPAAPLRDLNREQGIHFLPVRMTPALSRFYRQAELGIEDYPLMIGEGEAGRGTPVPTVATSMVLAAFDFPPGGQRGIASARFVQALAGNFPSLLVAPRDPRWQQADPAALPPDWTRYAPAVAWALARTEGVSPSGSSSQDARPRTESSRDRNQLFEEFLRWERQRQGGSPPDGAGK
jgi:uncharacterized protein